jgi:glycosyltransferase involved in cell wall biosynthesis
MLRIHHFNRDPRPANYTFEQLFGAIRLELEKSVKIDNQNLPAGLNKYQAIIWAKQRAGKINHITGDVNYLSYGLPKQGQIITVHDLGHYTRTLGGWKKYVYKKFWLDGPFSKAQALTAISEFTKNEMVQRLGVPESKIHIIGNPVLPGITFSDLPDNPKPIILQIGSGTNKNVARLIAAVKGLEVKLLLVNKLLDLRIKSLLKDSKVDFEQCADLDFNGLNQAYAKADVLFFASEYEGFGMPILEAQAAGRPVITSTVTSMPEAAGEKGAIFVDPYDVEQIRAAIIKIISSKSLQREYVQQGLENLKKYQIGHIAQQYLKLYEQVEGK